MADENGLTLEGKKNLRQVGPLGQEESVAADEEKEGANVIMLASYLFDFVSFVSASLFCV